MTPDTSAYMIAGFAAILGGITIYAFWLIARIKSLKRQWNVMQAIEKEGAQDRED